MERVRTGIEGFDAMVQGGLPMGSSVVLQGPPGQEKLLFALTFLADGLKAGGSGLVAISSQSADAALAQLRALGVDVVVPILGAVFVVMVFGVRRRRLGLDNSSHPM